jgi:hypothetical protein
MAEEDSRELDEVSAPAEQDPTPTEEGSPVPDPEREDGGEADDVPGAV